MTRALLLFLTGVFFFSLSYAQYGDNGQEASALQQPKRKYTMGRDLLKGTWAVGATFSAKSNKLADEDLLIADINQFSQRAYNIRAEGSYFIRDYLSVGIGVQYNEQRLDLDAGFLNNSYTRDIRSFRRGYGVLGFLKNYIPISSKDVFYITNQTELEYAYENGPSETVRNDVLERKYATKHTVGIGIRPGILIFFTKNFAFDANMGILGFTHYKEDIGYTYPPNNLPKEEDRKADTRNTSTNVNLRFDLLKLGFGFSYYL